MALFTEVFEDITKKGRKIPTCDYLENGTYPIIDQGKNDIAGYTNEIEGLFTDVPAIIFGDHTRVIKYVNTPCFLGADGVKLLKATIKNPNYEYLYYALSNAKIPDTGYNRHFKWLKELEIPLPSAQKQKQIVSQLHKIDELISLRKEQLTKLDQLVKSQFIEMFGDPETNNLGWEHGMIKDILSDVRYGSSRKAVENGKYPYLRMNNITYEGELDLSDTKRIDVPNNELSKCSVKRGDVLFNRTNSKELVGKTCLYDRDELMVLAGFVIRVRVNEKAIPEFLVTYMNLPQTKKLLLSMCRAACGQANINATEFQGIPIYIPPVELQKQFAAFKQQTDKSKFTIQQSLEKLETLKKSLMQQYFG